MRKYYKMEYVRAAQLLYAFYGELSCAPPCAHISGARRKGGGGSDQAFQSHGSELQDNENFMRI